MKLVIDSGGTKTSWAVVSGGRLLSQGHTKGMNPYTTPQEELTNNCRQILSGITAKEEVSELFFYGAGCRAESSKQTLKRLWVKYLPNATISIQDDLIAVAHALAQGKDCIACVLGTGASAGWYAQGEISRYAPSNGVWLGDEGSGADLGKRLIKAYLDKTLPKKLILAFEHEFTDRREDILRKVYQEQAGSAYLGGYAPFLHKHQAHPFIAKLINQAFSEFFAHIAQHLPTDKNLPVVIAGGVAANFFLRINEQAAVHHLVIANVCKAPLPNLLYYHGLSKETQ